MTTVRQLYALQEVDLDIDRVDRALAETEEELKTEISIENLETTLQAEEQLLKEVEARHNDNQMETTVRRERSESLESRLYDGSMVNARDLESLQHEAANVRNLLEQNEAVSLELSIQLEESQTRCAELHIELTEAKARWESRAGAVEPDCHKPARRAQRLRTAARIAGSEGGAERSEALRNSPQIQRGPRSRQGRAGSLPRMPDVTPYPIAPAGKERAPNGQLLQLRENAVRGIGCDNRLLAFMPVL